MPANSLIWQHDNWRSLIAFSLEYAICPLAPSQDGMGAPSSLIRDEEGRSSLLWEVFWEEGEVGLAHVSSVVSSGQSEIAKRFDERLGFAGLIFVMPVRLPGRNLFGFRSSHWLGGRGVMRIGCTGAAGSSAAMWMARLKNGIPLRTACSFLNRTFTKPVQSALALLDRPSLRRLAA